MRFATQWHFNCHCNWIATEV